MKMFSLKAPDPKKLSDEKLVRAMSNGNVEAFNELYNRYRSRMLYYFYRMLGGNSSIAEDFLQDLFFKLIDKPHLFDTRRKFSTWLFSVAHNMCKNEYRKREVRQILVSNNSTETVAVEEEPNQYAQVSAEDIYACLDEFDENHRSAFLLKYREGLNIDEISDILMLPPGTVKSRLFYTRKKIQKMLEYKSNESDELVPNKSNLNK
jgi:RNA polymerase sigma-70 factor (ECF subfamily)